MSPQRNLASYARMAACVQSLDLRAFAYIADDLQIPGLSLRRSEDQRPVTEGPARGEHSAAAPLERRQRVAARSKRERDEDESLRLHAQCLRVALNLPG